MATISQTELEAMILDALQNNLMEQDALAVFCDEHAKERNRLQAEAGGHRSALEKELATVKRDHAKLIDGIIAGIPADQVKDRMLALDTRRLQLETDLTKEPAPSPIRIHPTMAAPYRTRIGALIRRLQAPDGMLEATEALRGLLERTVLQPALNTGRLSAH
ncbi:MAG: recombinase family protein, partial [Roseovarius sp.]|nr:recombinase family protein [Roseovarius sp.]